MSLAHLFNVLLISLTFSILSGCQTMPLQSNQTPKSLEIPSLETAYDYHLVDSSTQKLINLPTLAQRLVDKDVIFIGEFHGNHASHLLEMQLQTELFKLRPQQILSMEMFERQQQTLLNRYLDGEIGERYLINETPTWPNYAGSYRPMIEFAKEHLLPVVAANASGDIVRCIGQYGKGYVDNLPTGEQPWIAQQAFENNVAYQTKFYDFMTSMKKMDANRKASSYAAQLARDNTMAESILDALQANPQHQLIHLNGSFHSASHLGTVALLKQRAPNLKIAVITPIRVTNPLEPSWSSQELASGDYVYLVRAQPEEYVDASYKRKAMQAMFNNSSEKAKQCHQPAP